MNHDIVLIYNIDGRKLHAADVDLEEGEY